jgi:hypothetical protein
MVGEGIASTQAVRIGWVQRTRPPCEESEFSRNLGGPALESSMLDARATLKRLFAIIRVMDRVQV